MYTDPSGEIGIPGAIGGAAFSIGMQMLICNRLGGDLYTCLKCVNWIDVGISAAMGSVMPTWFGNVIKPLWRARRMFVVFGGPGLGVLGSALKGVAGEAALGTVTGTLMKTKLPSYQIECEDECTRYRLGATTTGFVTSIF
jgi:hypothetical protein